MRIAPFQGLQIGIREYEPGDRPLILDSWIRSHKSQCRISPEVYLANHRSWIEALLAKPETKILVACSPDVPSTILGWLCGTGKDTVHYAFVGFELRKRGLFTLMLREMFGYAPKVISVTQRFGKDTPRFVYNPYKLGWVA